MITELQARPPIFEYFMKPVEDRTASELQHYLVEKDQPWVRVRQLGSNDEMEQPAEQWIEQMERESRLRPKLMPPRWVEMFKDVYQRFLRGEAQQVDGVPIQNVNTLSKSEINNLKRIGIQTAEDGAGMNEECKRRYGMGGEAVKQKCIAWMKSLDANKAAGEITTLKSENEALKLQVGQQGEKLKELEAMIAALQPNRAAGGKRG
jgi:hypothetical protein